MKCLEVNYSQRPGQPGCSAAVLIPGSSHPLELNQAPELCLAAFVSPGTLGLTPKIPGIPPGFVCSIKRWPDKCCACSLTHPLHQWSSFFLLITEYLKVSYTPIFVIRLKNNFGGCKNDTLVCSVDFFDFLSCLKSCWWWHILRLESYRISGWAFLECLRKLELSQWSLGCSNYDIQGTVSRSCHKQSYLPVVVGESFCRGWEWSCLD